MDIKVYNELDKRAREYAQSVAPKPKYEPVIAGLTGILASQAAVMVFVAMAGLEMEAYTVAATITSAIAFAGPFFWFRNEANKHHKAVDEEIARLQALHAENAASAGPCAMDSVASSI